MIPYFYNSQIKRYLVQFMYLFSDMQVKIGKSANNDERLIKVPIHFSQMDKVAANIVAGGTTNNPIRVPVMSCDLMAIRYDPLTFVGLNMEHTQTFLPENGYFAEDVKSITRLRPAVYNMEIDLAIWTSNTDQHFQILEQILPVFNPSVQIQTSDAQFDWTKITTVKLEGMVFNNNYPLGTNNRILMTNMTFTVPIYLSAPVNVQAEYVRNVLLRLGTVTDSDMNDILGDFDSQDIPYESIASVDKIVDKLDTP